MFCFVMSCVVVLLSVVWYGIVFCVALCRVDVVLLLCCAAILCFIHVMYYFGYDVMSIAVFWCGVCCCLYVVCCVLSWRARALLCFDGDV